MFNWRNRVYTIISKMSRYFWKKFKKTWKKYFFEVKNCYVNKKFIHFTNNYHQKNYEGVFHLIFLLIFLANNLPYYNIMVERHIKTCRLLSLDFIGNRFHSALFLMCILRKIVTILTLKMSAKPKKCLFCLTNRIFVCIIAHEIK
jgi:hypothetical protein